MSNGLADDLKCVICGAMDLIEEVYENCRVCGWEHYEANNPYSLREAQRMWAAGETIHPDFPYPGRLDRL